MQIIFIKIVNYLKNLIFYDKYYQNKTYKKCNFMYKNILQLEIKYKIEDLSEVL